MAIQQPPADGVVDVPIGAHMSRDHSSPSFAALVGPHVAVIGDNVVAIAIATLPCLVAIELARDVAAERSVPLRSALEAAARRASSAVRWTLATMLSWAATWVGALIFAFGVISIFGNHEAGHNPVLTFMLPGSVIMSIGLVAGVGSAIGAVRALARLHANVSART